MPPEGPPKLTIVHRSRAIAEAQRILSGLESGEITDAFMLTRNSTRWRGYIMWSNLDELVGLLVRVIVSQLRG